VHRFSTGKVTGLAVQPWHCSLATTRLQSWIPFQYLIHRVIEWDINISSGNLGAHDMIIGRDILQGLGMKFNFTNLTVEWDGAMIPMRDVDSMTNEAFHIHDPDAVAEATDHVKAILDVKYKKADLAEVAQSATHLSETEREELHQFLS
jgi:hypothetical protein